MEHKLDIEIKWENEKSFSLDAKLDQEDNINILTAEENGDIELLWHHIQKTLEVYFRSILAKIGTEMKS